MDWHVPDTLDCCEFVRVLCRLMPAEEDGDMLTVGAVVMVDVPSKYAFRRWSAVAQRHGIRFITLASAEALEVTRFEDLLGT